MDEGWFERMRLELTRELLEAVGRNRDIGHARDKLLVSLSGGALVFSMTLLSALARGKHWLGALFSAWGFFAASIVLVIIGMRRAELAEVRLAEQLNTRLSEIEAHRDARNVRPSLKFEATRDRRGIWFNHCSVGTFLAGVVCLAIFVGVNLAWG